MPDITDIETTRLNPNWRSLEVVNKDINGKYPKQITVNYSALQQRLAGDLIGYSGEIKKRSYSYHILDATLVGQMTARMKRILDNNHKGQLPSNDDLEVIAQYLSWSFERETGKPIEEEIKNLRKQGITTAQKDLWVLYHSIKNKLQTK